MTASAVSRRATERRPRPPPPTWPRRTLLIADADERQMARVAALFRPAFDVIAAPDGNAAMDALGARRIDVALVDIDLPSLGGLELLARMRATAPAVRLVVATAVRTLDTVVDAMKLGCADYLAKPVSPERLVRAVGAGGGRAGSTDEVTEAARARVPEGNARNVLVVTPDLGFAATLGLILGRRHPVYSASSVISALRAASRHAPHVVVYDRALGGHEGLYLLRQIRRAEPECPMLVVHDVERPGLAADTELAGAIDGLVSTSAWDDLFTAVASVLGDTSRDVAGSAFGAYVGRSLTYLGRHYSLPVTVVAVASAVGISAARFAHVFRAEVGMAPKEYLRQLRLEVGRQLLQETGHKLHYIAEAAGFSDAAHFSRLFRRTAGQRPGEYRREAARSGPRPCSPLRHDPRPAVTAARDAG